MKKYTNYLIEEKKSQSDMTMEEYLRDDKGCQMEGINDEGKQIWSCPDNVNSIGTYKVLDDNDNFKIQFNEVQNFSITDGDLTSLKGGPIKTIAYKINLAKIKNLNYFAKFAKHIEISMTEELTSLEGLPKRIEGDLYINFAYKLTSLKGIPDYIGGNLVIESTSITNLEYFPKYVGSNITFISNKLTSLKGIVNKVNGFLKIEKEKHLKSLEGGPEYVDKNLNLSGTDNLETYNGFPKNNLKSDWYSSDGPPEIENEFILNFRYIDNKPIDYDLVRKEMNDLGLDPTKSGNGYNYDKFYKKDNEPSYTDYWKDLLNFILNFDKSKISDVKWPKEFISKQSEEIKNLMISSNSLKKFNM